MTDVIETSGLTKRYRRATALSDCTISVPEGRSLLILMLKYTGECSFKTVPYTCAS